MATPQFSLLTFNPGSVPIFPRGNDGVKAAADPDETAGLHVIDQEGFLRPRIARTFGYEKGGQPDAVPPEGLTEVIANRRLQ